MSAAAVIPMSPRQLPRPVQWNRSPRMEYYEGLTLGERDCFNWVNQLIADYPDRPVSAREVAKRSHCSEDTAARRLDAIWRKGKLEKYTKAGEANIYRLPFEYAGPPREARPLHRGYVKAEVTQQLPIRASCRPHEKGDTQVLPRHQQSAAGLPSASDPARQSPVPIVAPVAAPLPAPPPAAAAVPKPAPRPVPVPAPPPAAARESEPDPPPPRFENDMAEICWHFQTNLGNAPSPSALYYADMALIRAGVTHTQWLHVLRATNQFRSWRSYRHRPHKVTNPDGLFVALAQRAKLLARGLPPPPRQQLKPDATPKELTTFLLANGRTLK